MSGPASPQQLQSAVAAALFGELQRSTWADGWTQATATLIEAGYYSSRSVDVLGPDGRRMYQARPIGDTAKEPWHDLRAAMANPRDGAWLLSTLVLTADGAFRFSFEYDRRPYAHSRDGDYFAVREERVALPSEDAWRADFERFPRAPDRMPAWAAELLRDDTDGLDPRELFAKELASRPGFPRGLRKLDRDEGWRTLHAAVGQRVGDALLSGAWNRAATPDRQRRANQLGGLLQDVFDRVLTEDVFPRRAGFVIDLWRSWATTEKRKAPEGLDSVDRAASLEDEVSGPMEEVGDDVADVLGELIAADLTDRFGVSPA